MEQNRDHYINNSNLYKDKLAHCKKQIKTILKKNVGEKGYVGGSQNVDNRADDHSKNKPMDTMFILTTCKDLAQAIKLEKKLIELFGDKYLTNIGRGGAGLKKGENDIYFLF